MKQKYPVLKATWKILISVAVFAIMIYLLYKLFDIVFAFSLSLFFAYLLAPLVKKLETRMPRIASIFTIFSGGIFIFILILGLLVPLFTEGVVNIYNQIQQIEIRSDDLTTESKIPFIQDLTSRIQQIDTKEIQDFIVEKSSQIAEGIKGTLQQSFGLISSIGGTIIIFTFILLFTFFILLEREKVYGFIIENLPSKGKTYFKKREKNISKILFTWIKGQCILSLCLGVLTYIGLWSLELFGISVPEKLSLAIIGGLAEFIPYVGPIMAAAPSLLLVITEGWGAIMGVIILYIIIQSIEGNVLVPYIIGKVLDVSPLLVLLITIIGASIGGIFGVIVAMPGSALLHMFYQDYKKLRKTNS